MADHVISKLLLHTYQPIYWLFQFLRPSVHVKSLLLLDLFLQIFSNLDRCGANPPKTSM